MILTFALVNVKTIFMAFSEKLNFKRKKHFSPAQKLKLLPLIEFIQKLLTWSLTSEQWFMTSYAFP